MDAEIGTWAGFSDFLLASDVSVVESGDAFSLNDDAPEYGQDCGGAGSIGSFGGDRYL